MNFEESYEDELSENRQQMFQLGVASFSLMLQNDVFQFLQDNNKTNLTFSELLNILEGTEKRATKFKEKNIK